MKKYKSLTINVKKKDQGVNGRKSEDGIKNLVSIVSAVFLLKLISESIRKYGFLVRIPLEDVSFSETLHFAKTLFLAAFKCSVSFIFVTKSRLFVGLTLLFSEMLVAYINLHHIHHMYFSATSLCISIYFLAKMISFCSFNRQNCNLGRRKDTVYHFIYYLLAPTISYKIEYKRRSKTSYKRVLSLFLRFLGSSFLLVFLIDQLAEPSIDEVQRSTGLCELIESFLTLSICTTLIFLIFFYLFFCCLVEIFADITMFGDSEFYGKWWNARTVKEFWCTWNRTAHLWFRRQVFIPMIKLGFSRRVSNVTCFVVSGLMHEYVVGVSTKAFRGWMFLGFLAQALLMETTDRIALLFPKYGNFMFWCLFCVIGQPGCIWLNYRSTCIEKQGIDRTQK